MGTRDRIKVNDLDGRIKLAEERIVKAEEVVASRKASCDATEIAMNAKIKAYKKSVAKLEQYKGNLTKLHDLKANPTINKKPTGELARLRKALAASGKTVEDLIADLTAKSEK